MPRDQNNMSRQGRTSSFIIKSSAWWNKYNRNTPVKPYSYIIFLTQALNCLSHDCKQNTQCQARVKNTPYFSPMCIKFTPFSDMSSPKAILFRAAHTSESPCSKVTANECFVLGSQRFVLIAFKLKLVALNVLSNRSIQFLQCVTITWHRNEIDIARHIYISTRTEHKLFSFQARDWRWKASLL